MSQPIGDDRAAFNTYDQADRHIVAPLREQQEDKDVHTETSGSDVEQKGGGERSSALAKVRKASRAVGSRARAKSSKILHIRDRQDSGGLPAAPALAPPSSLSTDDDRLFQSPPEYKGVQATDLLHKPVNTVQSALHGASGAKMAQVVDNQVIAHGANVNLVRAHDKVAAADGEEARKAAFEDVGALNKMRQDTYVRWTMDRHVLKVRRIPPLNLTRPRRVDYMQAGDRVKHQAQWAQYGKDLARYYAKKHGDQYIDESPELPPATEEAINTSIERLLMSSIPYQVFLMKIRHIYRWDNPTETGIMLISYIFLWYANYLGAAMIILSIFFVLKRRFLPPTVDDLRESIRRSEDIDQTATNITQLIEQNGSKGWIDAAITDIGPRALLQLEDMANTLEILRNFYEWRKPRQTTASLSLLFVCLTLVLFTPLWLLFKAMQFAAGVMFFGLLPVSSRLPHYRLIVSPLTWLFWKIPTDAEWAIARLQTEANFSHDAIKARKNETKKESEPGSDSITDIGKYHCKYLNHQGNLHLTTRDVRYVTAVRSHELFKIRYDEIKTIQKTRFGDQIIFGLEKGLNCKVESLKLTNEVFTQVVGYSGLIWQVTG